MALRKRLCLVFLAFLAFGFPLLRSSQIAGLKDLADLTLKSRSREGVEADFDDAASTQQLLSSDRLRSSDADNLVEGEDGGDDALETEYLDDDNDYRELFSITTRDRKFFPIYFGGDTAYNPNIIPHPTKHDMWIVVAQHEQSRETISVSEELMCVAGFLNGVLVCTETPIALPIAPSIAGVCEGDLAYLNFRSGPRDARMFNGPDSPLIVYGSQSQYTCLGIWVQDVRMMLDSFRLERFALSKLFTVATELLRPAPWKGVEKNFFLFWDSEGKAFVHYDITPARVFAQLDFDGASAKTLRLSLPNKTRCVSHSISLSSLRARNPSTKPPTPFPSPSADARILDAYPARRIHS